MLKCSNIPQYQNILRWAKYPNIPKSIYVPLGKIHPSGKNMPKPPKLYATYGVKNINEM